MNQTRGLIPGTHLKVQHFFIFTKKKSRCCETRALFLNEPKGSWMLMTLSDKERKDERDSNQSLRLPHCAGKVNFSLQALLIFNFKSFRYKT